MRKLFLFILFLPLFSFTQNVQWPFPDPNIQGYVIGSIGEFRRTNTIDGVIPRFHKGNDLRFDKLLVTSTEKSIHAINGGTIINHPRYYSNGTINPWKSYVKVGAVYYYHIWASNDIQNGTLTTAVVNDYLGEMLTEGIGAHVHLQHPNYNYLTKLTPYIDESIPFFINTYLTTNNGVEFYKNGITFNTNSTNRNELLLNRFTLLNNQPHLNLYGKIDIATHIKDFRTNPDHTGDTGEISTNKISWSLQKNSTVLLSNFLMFDKPPPNNDNAKYVFHPLSLFEPYRSINIITSNPYELNQYRRDQFLNTKIKIGQVESFELREAFRDGNLDSKINSFCQIKDDIYHIIIEGCDVSTNHTDNCVSKGIPILIDNFLPYIKKVTLSDASGVFYMGEWNLNSMETALEFQYCSTGATERQGFDIEVETSETMSALSFQVSGVPASLTLTPDETKTIWSNSFASTINGEHTLTFIGTDLANNQLRRMQGDTANLYYRTGDNTWYSETTGSSTSSPLLGNDTKHTFNIAPHLSSNCTGGTSCADSTEIEPNNNAQQARQVTGVGLCFDTNPPVSINAKLDLSYNDEDWYKFGADYQGVLNVTMSGNISDLDIDLLDYNENVIDSGQVVNNTKTLFWQGNGGLCQVLYVRVKSNSSSGCKDYNLTFDWDSLVSCNATRTSNKNAPPPTISGDSNYCFGETIQLSVTNGSTKIWYFDGVESGSGSSFTYSNASVGDHTVVLLDTTIPCFIETKPIHIYNSPTANAGQDQNISTGESIQLQGLGGGTYSWTPSSSLNNPNIWNPIATPNQTTTYTLTVVQNGCTDTDQVTVYVDETGGGTTPNNDDCVNAELLTSHTSPNFIQGTVSGATESLGANQCTGCSCTSPDDYDVYYKFVAVSNTHTITLNNLANNFDAVIEIRDGCGFNTNLTCYDPFGAVSPMSLTYTNFTIGQTYYIRIFEWDYINSPPLSPTFNIAVTHSSTTQGFDLVSNIINVSDSNPSAGDSIAVTYSITNNGNTTFFGNFGSALYLSTNQIYSSSDDFLVGSLENLTSINAGQTRTFTNFIQIQSNVNNGQYYIISNPDIGNDISETDENNNYDFYPIQIGNVVTNGPNLDIKGLIVTPNTNLAPGQEVNIETEIKNNGNEDCNNFKTLFVFDRNNNDIYDAGDIVIGTKYFSGIDAGERKTRDGNFFLPLNIPSIGNYQIIAIADSDNEINETDEGDNNKNRNITISTINPAGPDIVGRYVKWVINGTNQQVSPQNLCLDTEYRLYWEIENVGNLDVNGGRSISHSAYISKDQYYDGTDEIFDSHRWNEASHDVGVVLSANDNNNWEGIAPGDWYLLIIADDDNDINEINEQNNVTAYPIRFVNCNNTPYPDLVMKINSVTPFSSALGDYLTTEMTITNNGNAPISNFYVSLYLSDDQIFQGSGGNNTFNDHRLQDNGDVRITDTLNPGESMQVSMHAYTKSDRGLQAPITQTGIYYLFAAIDENGTFIELDRTNNIDFVPIEINSVDCYIHIFPNGTSDGIVQYAAGFGEWIDIRTEESCSWTVFGEEDWISTIGSNNGQGNDITYFYVDENPNPFSRTGHININGEIYQFVQEAKPCELLTGNAKISISSSNITDVTCNQTGAIDLNIQNGFPPYTYSWSNGATTQNLANLLNGGDYSVTITDITGCSINSTFTVNESIDINATITQLENHLDASEVINASYQWLDCNNGNSEIVGETNEIFTVHNNGNYAVQITTDNCTAVSDCVAVNYFHIWRNLNWINGVPTIGDHVVIDDDYDTSVYGNIEAKTIYVEPNKILTIKANQYVKVFGDLINKGTIIVENQGSFVQVENSASVTGSNFQIQKTTNPYVEYDYTYWSSPIENANLLQVFSASPLSGIYSFNTSNFSDVDNDTFDDDNNAWIHENGLMLVGKGYIVMGEGSDFPFDSQNMETGLIQNVSFNGKINNGIITTQIDLDANNTDAFTNQNLIGNPYSSAIDIKKLYQINNSILEGTFYFWTHDSPLSSDNPGPNAFDFTNNDYATATTNGTLFNQINGGTAGTMAPEFIASGQGFMVDAINQGTLVFNNEMRVTGPNNQFRRPTTTTDSELERAWFSLTNSDGVYRQILIGFFNEATDNYDNGIDGKRLESGDTNIDFYSLLNNTKLAINGLEIFNEQKTIPLGITVPVSDSFVISLDSFEGNLVNTEIYLKDNLTNSLYDLKQSPYSFTSLETGSLDTRFEIIFVKSSLSIDDSAISNELIANNVDDTQIRFRVENNIISKLKVFDVLGRLLINEKPNKNDFFITTSINKGTILFVNVVLENGRVLQTKFVKL